ncbi:MAG TPA: hypothetical protein VGG33_08320 [Polyangia bacterium]
MRTSPSSERLGLRALVLASAIASASACAPAPMDAGNGSRGGSTGSGSGGSTGSGGSASSGSGGSSSSGSGGSSSSGTGGSSSGSGGSSMSGSGGARNGGTTGSGGTMAGSGGASGMGGTMAPRDGGAMETGGGADMGGPAAPTFTMVYSMYIGPTCGTCHSMATAGNHKGVVLANKAAAFMTMNAVAGTIVAGNAANSNLVKLLQNMGTGTAKRMPPGGTLATAAQIKLVSDWINAGAMDN